MIFRSKHTFLMNFNVFCVNVEIYNYELTIMQHSFVCSRNMEARRIKSRLRGFKERCLWKILRIDWGECVTNEEITNGH